MRAERLHDPLPQFHRGDGRAGPERASRGCCWRGEDQRLIPGPCFCCAPISRYGAITCSCFTPAHAHCGGQNHGEAAGRNGAPPVNHCPPSTAKLYDRDNDGTSLNEYAQIGI